MKNRRKNYTLTEILVVIIILAVVMAIALPGFNNLVNGNKTMRAAKQLAAAFQQARAEAIVSGCKVVLLLPCQFPNGTRNNNIRTNYSNSSYGVLVYDKAGSNVDLNSVRNSNFKWQRLPGGVIISLATSNSHLAGGAYFAANASMPFSGGFSVDSVQNKSAAFGRLRIRTGQDFGSVPCVTFYPDGTADNSLNIFLTEGFVKSDGTLTATNNSSNNNRPANSVGFEYNRFTGRVKYYETL